MSHYLHKITDEISKGVRSFLKGGKKIKPGMTTECGLKLNFTGLTTIRTTNGWKWSDCPECLKKKPENE